MGINAEILIRRVRKEAATDDAIKLWSWDLCRSIGARHFFIDRNKRQGAISRSNARYREDSDPPPGAIYYQDGDPIHAADGECLLEVSVWSRYYGVGYERGDLLTLCGIAEWIEANIPCAEVWYGGDSSGVLAKPWSEVERKKLRQHLYSTSGRDYFNHEAPALEPEPCALCVPGRGRIRHGWGDKYHALSCAGCGLSVESRDDGETWQESKD